MATKDYTTLPIRLSGTTRDSISPSMRQTIRNAVRETHPRCPVCGQRILDEYNIGHIISAFHHGPTTYDNLVVVHRYCNIGTDDITDYVNKYDPKEILMLKYVP